MAACHHPHQQPKPNTHLKRGHQHKIVAPQIASNPTLPPQCLAAWAKAKFRLDGAGCSTAPNPIMDSGDDMRELPDSIKSFPTKHQPVMDTVLKDILLSLRRSLQADMMNCMHRFNNEIQAVEPRAEHIEHKMGKYVATRNYLVDILSG